MLNTKRKVPFSVLIIASMIGMLALLLLSSFGSKKRYVHHDELTINHITQGFANIYVVQQDNKLLMIDSGNPDKGDALASELLKIGINPRDIDYLILTHAHPDHAGNARYFQMKFGVKVISGNGEEDMIERHGEDEHLCPTGFLGRIVKKTVAQKRYDPFLPDITVAAEFDLKDLGFDGSIIPIPGHTPGSLVVTIGEAVFVGDIIRGKALNKKKPARHIFVCDFDQNLTNIETISRFKNVNYWYPGHGGPLQLEEIQRFITKEKSK